MLLSLYSWTNLERIIRLDENTSGFETVHPKPYLLFYGLFKTMHLAHRSPSNTKDPSSNHGWESEMKLNSIAFLNLASTQQGSLFWRLVARQLTSKMYLFVCKSDGVIFRFDNFVLKREICVVMFSAKVTSSWTIN